ncbi:hypothetical protein [Xanthomarina sp. F2636L]|uniref:hypothetical protein n=1 Tax=Xanthomarina sp. F2636L TaxID=2996018 RepID=UPI00225E0A90|nr:hypothetical protein [Xanthomarina sp. F2636L]MCX7550683.1 hypothetical protein [Xanthomarina sp. F2636L]
MKSSMYGTGRASMFRPVSASEIIPCNAFKKAFLDKKVDISNFVKENNFDYLTKRDVVKILSYYNSL